MRALLWVALLWLGSTPARAQILGDVVDSFTDLGTATTQVAGKKTQISHQSGTITGPFTGAVVEVGTNEANPEAFFRFLINEQWSDWRRAHISPSATGGTLVAGYRQDEVIGATRFEFRIDVEIGQLTEIRNGGVFNNAQDEDRKPGPELEPIMGSKSGNIIPPRLITRAMWNARPFVLGSPVRLADPNYEYMTMHHAAGYSAENETQGKAQMLAMQDLHQNVRGWSDIGYQFAIDRAGNLYQGRPFMDNSTSLAQVPVLARGAHVGEANTGNIGVVIMGCYHPPEGSYCEQEMTPAAYNTYKTLFAFLSERYGVSPTLIRGHRDFSQTSCPGDNNYVLLPNLRLQVADLLLTGNEPLGTGDMTASVASNGTVELNWGLTDNFGVDSLYVDRITSLGTTTIVIDAFTASTFNDASLAGESNVTYLLIASGSNGRRQELARVELEIADPSSYLLTGAFPNPASSTSEFRYFLSVEGLVSISLYDALGREVADWDAGFLSEDQWYTQSVDVSGLTPGMYFFRIRVSGFSGVAFDKTHPIVVAR